MSATVEKVGELLADVLPRIAALGEEAQAEISRVREEAGARMARYEEATAEAEKVEAEIEHLTLREEEVPGLAYRANLRKDYELEDDLRDEYEGIEPRLAELRERKTSLEEETAELLPNARGHRNDAAIERTAAVAGSAFEERMALEELRDRLKEALDAIVEPVADTQEQAKGAVMSLTSTIEWERSPVGRGAAR